MPYRKLIDDGVRRWITLPATFVWLGSNGRERNRFVLFRRSFVLDTTLQDAPIHIFADSFYDV